MKRDRIYVLALVLICIAAVLGACATEVSVEPAISPISPLSLVATPTETLTPQPTPTLDPSKSSITGGIVQESSGQSVINTRVWLGRVFWNEQQTDAAFAIEAGSSPSTLTDENGSFMFANVEPASYVLVIGSLDGAYTVVAQSDNPDEARVLELSPGELLELGELIVNTPIP